jgi:hypothetical protein
MQLADRKSSHLIGNPFEFGQISMRMASWWCSTTPGGPLFDEPSAAAVRPAWPSTWLTADGVDLRRQSLRERKAALARVGKGAYRWIALTKGVVGDGCALCRSVVDADLEGIVAKQCAVAQPPLLTASRLRRMVSRARGGAMLFGDETTDALVLAPPRWLISNGARSNSVAATCLARFLDFSWPGVCAGGNRKTAANI